MTIARICGRTLNATRLEKLRHDGFVFSRMSRCYLQTRRNSSTARESDPFRMAIIGSGPAGFYTAYKVMSRITTCVIDMYEALPVPFGLVRYGVAPDHPEVKNCEDKFKEVAASDRFNFVGNVTIGHSVPLQSLVQHYNAVLFSYGASQDRKLGIPGEDLRGVFSARDFVGWYNGLPEHADLAPDLSSSEEAVVIGQGNVALDVARILLTDVGKLNETDITEHAITALSRSRVKKVRVVGRRGPMQASFTIKELRELLTLPEVSFDLLQRDLLPPGPSSKLPRTQRRMVDLLNKGSAVQDGSKGWSLDFLLSPVSFKAHDSTATLSSVEFVQNQLQGEDIFSPSAQVSSSSRKQTLQSGLAFRSIGYRSEALPGMEDLGIHFDKKRGIITNDGFGRAIKLLSHGNEDEALPGLYCSGWVKRGPAGVIANTMEDAFSTAEAIVSDWKSNKPFMTGGEGWDRLRHESENQSLRSTTWNDWLKIDDVEINAGKEKGKSREKLTRVSDMLNILV